MHLGVFRQVQFHLVCSCAGVFHVCDLWTRNTWETENPAGESVAGDCHCIRGGRIAPVMDCLPVASEAAPPRVLRPVLACVVAVQVYLHRCGYRTPVV